MPTINIEELKAGMLLAEDAVHLNGRVLLRAGVEINDKHIRTLKTWGVYAVTVRGGDEGDDGYVVEEIAPDLYHEAERQMRGLFRHTDLAHPAIAELFKLRVRDYARCLERSAKS